jgi:hypothetical protein
MLHDDHVVSGFEVLGMVSAKNDGLFGKKSQNAMLEYMSRNVCIDRGQRVIQQIDVFILIKFNIEYLVMLS